ncbi:glycosyltransferase family 22 protein [Chaetomium sp. MPI-SDFR-AT-0129]|nr:glycosyltransferase family 22 protein [Chaetomium sp. MPI-SDFR-AT-0129]
MESPPDAKGLRQRQRHGAGSIGVSREAEETSTDSPKEDAPRGLESKGTSEPVALHAQVAAAQVSDVLSLLLFFRFLNALCVRTFFQPDEYFQALEPAWSIAFGEQSGAWMTWEWQHQLRSSLHPAIFGLAYKAAEGLMGALHLFPPFKAVMLVALPGALQSVFAALGDFYTWKLAMDIYGRESNFPWAALWMTVLNPWQWYCSTRTFSNSLETTLTIAALSYWPWAILNDAKGKQQLPLQANRGVMSLRISLILAAVAVLLRPTNLLIWLVVLAASVIHLTATKGTTFQSPVLLVLLREIAVCGTAVLAISLVSDRLYFGFWTFPPYNWLYFNLSQSLAVFYGHMPWHYYLVQGVPLLTTTFLPFVLVGLRKTSAAWSSQGPSGLQTRILGTLNLCVLAMIAALTIISHKEVRFIYPLLPVLHILAAPYITAFFTQPSATPASTSKPSPPTSSQPEKPIILRHKLTLVNLLSVNILLAGYLTLFHQPAPLSVLTFLRTEFERVHPDALSFDERATHYHHNPISPTTVLDISNNITTATTTDQKELFALFLTPCHTTPWRSHLVYPALRARALTCEPPLHTAPGTTARATYLDEADRFYLPAADSTTRGAGGNGDADSDAVAAAPYGVHFLAEEMWPLLSAVDEGAAKKADASHIDKQQQEQPPRRTGEIPRYIIGFEGIEPVLQAFFGSDIITHDDNQSMITPATAAVAAAAPGRGMGVRLTRVWSAWNGAFNEDWRRRGRLVVWETGVYGQRLAE